MFSPIAAGPIAASEVGAATGVASGGFDMVGASVAAAQAPIRIIRGDDAPDWRRQFYDRQVAIAADAIDAVATRPTRKNVASAVKAIAPLKADPVIAASMTRAADLLAALASSRRGTSEAVATARSALRQAEVARRRRKSNEAALLLMIA